MIIIMIKTSFEMIWQSVEHQNKLIMIMIDLIDFTLSVLISNTPCFDGQLMWLIAGQLMNGRSLTDMKSMVEKLLY